MKTTSRKSFVAHTCFISFTRWLPPRKFSLVYERRHFRRVKWSWEKKSCVCRHPSHQSLFRL